MKLHVRTSLRTLAALAAVAAASLLAACTTVYQPKGATGGYTDTREGVQLRVDGLHFTAGGAAIVWRWLGPQLIDLAHGTLPNPTEAPTQPSSPTPTPNTPTPSRIPAASPTPFRTR